MRYTLFHNQNALWFRPGTLRDLYIMGYSGVLPTPSTGSIKSLLETVWTRHNRDDRPDGHLNPSLSVGDVVVLAPDLQFGEPYMYTVDKVGWKELIP